MGYSGAFEIVRRIARVLRNPSFNRNFAGVSRLPYFDSWYKEEPFAYINDNAALNRG